ncbi:hypothetical protein GGI25_003857 [Coemansia spiralis]|uniref:LYR motif-containing protein Cup1-like N-terminal domain-containing protein n=2 Tax=Coemansia TaxID=4863 RepID=A0A9W8G5A4_9FUNG|nr:hypothetical protein BX070DRAFT_140892 [Coemansia spiralis]KAJ1991004.1 hypothetical protein EDC05_003724 [Coemansia umbellata]KAJ2621014.1 hypothetical protein GGI26_004514 [Coemansia sp. RSA 1358]KAJ2675763.1 hypothetical protein GGI25_003857 [Coemansia spiralis]
MEFLLRSKSDYSKLPSRQQVTTVYRGILKQARAFFDENTRDFIQAYAKQQFRINLHDRKVDRARRKVKSARTTLHLLERANTHRYKDVMSVLEYGYGRKGPRKVEMLQATAGVSRREQVFGNLREVARYRPAFYAIANNQFGTKKLIVSDESLKSKHPLNVAKMQDIHWRHVRYRIMPPIDRATMNLLEKRAQTGVITSALIASGELTDDEAHMVRKWEQRWVKIPMRNQVVRFYRTLLDMNMVVMGAQVKMVPNKGKYHKSLPRRNILDGTGAVKPDLIPKKVYTFERSQFAGRKPPRTANSIDLVGI